MCRQALAAEVTQASVPADVCGAALQGVQGALWHVAPPRRAALLAAASSLSSRATARSAVKAACLDFQLALLAKGGAVLYPDPVTGVPLLPEGVLIEWLQVSSKHANCFSGLNPEAVLNAQRLFTMSGPVMLVLTCFQLA